MSFPKLFVKRPRRAAWFARAEAAIEEPALHRVARQCERCSEVLARGVVPPTAKFELADRRGKAGYAARRSQSVIKRISSSPRSGPSFCATAMARLSATIGDGRMVINAFKLSWNSAGAPRKARPMGRRSNCKIGARLYTAPAWGRLCGASGRGGYSAAASSGSAAT